MYLITPVSRICNKAIIKWKCWNVSRDGDCCKKHKETKQQIGKKKKETKKTSSLKKLHVHFKTNENHINRQQQSSVKIIYI